MKDVIRCGVFETNSSSEHSIILMKSEDYRAWIDHKAMARLCGMKESENTYGNFWSSKIDLEFTYDFNSIEESNKCIALEHAKANVEGLEAYKDKIMECAKQDDDFSKASLKADQNWCERCIEKCNMILQSDDPVSHYSALDKFKYGMWMTYDEFWKAFTEEDDCYSPFEHDDKELQVHVIGKYFHS